MEEEFEWLVWSSSTTQLKGISDYKIITFRKFGKIFFSLWNVLVVEFNRQIHPELV
jgi:hypothetical protein